jgi:integrase
MNYDEVATTIERVRYITPLEYKQLLNVSRGDPRAYLLFLVVGNMGLRIIEAHRILVEDVLGDSIIRIHTAKQKEDVVHEMNVPRLVHEKVQEWIKKMGLVSGQPIFGWTKRNSQKLWTYYSGKAGLVAKGENGHRGRGIHSLRHMLGLRLASAGARAVSIKNMLRHRSLSATMAYLHMVNSGKFMDRLGAIG